MSARLISCRRQCEEEQKEPKQLNESPNLGEESCQGSGSSEGSGEASGGGSTEGSLEGSAGESGEGSGEESSEVSASGSDEGSGEGSAEEAIEFRCSTGRNITEGTVCEGGKDCRGLGEDEKFEACYQIFKDYDDEPHKLCAQIYIGNELVPQFPCFKTGHCIPSKLVR